MQTLNADQVAALVKSTPEKTVFDWKSDFTLPQDNDKQGEFIKDLTAIANACVDGDGFIIYGVDPRRPEPILGISVRYDDAKLQQLARGKIEPLPEFLYYEVVVESKVIGILQISPSRHRPHIISVDLGKVRRGQILIRRGSTTDGVTINDLLEFFYGPTSTHFPLVIQRMRAHTERQLATVEYMRELRAQQDDILRDMERAVGLPKGSL
jgi:predicted HTH transcriptional regulator